jgi:ribosomal protein S18 acetylase RimI-like enzyme
MVAVRVLGPDDAAILGSVAPDVFDHEIHPRWSAEFLLDPRHHLAVAIDDGQVVGFASAVHYVHPDKPPELWINEVGVSPAHRKQGIASRVLRALFDVGRALGCREAWVLTDRSNAAATRLYASVGGTEPLGDVVYYTFRLEAGPTTSC